VLREAVLVVRLEGEWLGYLCECTLDDGARAKFDDACANARMDETY
jgi:hypothetical protein